MGRSDIGRIESKARALRVASLEMIHAAGSGHPGPALSIADIIAALYYGVLRIDRESLERADRDRFVLSKGHGCASLYAALLDLGIVAPQERARFRSHGGMLQGHPRASTPGVEATTGPLGIGASLACGMAVAGLRDDFRVYALLGDGELQAGIVWEAALFASHNRLANLTYIVDVNGLQYTGPTSDVIGLEPLIDKWLAFGWDAVSVDGHDIEALVDQLSQTSRTKPRVLLARTTKGKGVSFMENVLGWHGKAPNDQELASALAELAS